MAQLIAHLATIVSRRGADKDRDGTNEDCFFGIKLKLAKHFVITK